MMKKIKKESENMTLYDQLQECINTLTPQQKKSIQIYFKNRMKVQV